MKSRNGTDYTQNYDLITKWLAGAFKGETLKVLGLNTGKIQEVLGFEPADIAIRTGRLDIIFRDENNAYYHLEEQRNPRKADLYRSASYHFFAGQQWGANITDIILVSGDVRLGSTDIKTQSGHYYPTIIDLSERDGHKGLQEIQKAVQKERFKDWLELVFLPLYGKETGDKRSKFVKQILQFESTLCKAKKLSPMLLAASLIMSNKLIDKESLMAIWEEIKMLDIIEIAEEKGKAIGLKEGKYIGLQEGKCLGLKEGNTQGRLENAHDMIIYNLFDRFIYPPDHILEQIKAIQNVETLKRLLSHIFKCKDIKDFEAILKQIQR